MYCVAVCCSVLQLLEGLSETLKEQAERFLVSMYGNVFCLPACCSVLQCVAVCCSVLQSQEGQNETLKEQAEIFVVSMYIFISI